MKNHCSIAEPDLSYCEAANVYVEVPSDVALDLIDHSSHLGPHVTVTVS